MVSALASLLLLTLLPCALCLVPVGAFCQSKWPGVDDTVVEKFARENGRGARPPIIDMDRGDLLLFLFLLAGAVGGFAAGYWWRVLLSGKPGRDPAKKDETDGT